jgi:hypothetical protein
VLGLLRGLLEALEGHAILAEVDPVLRPNPSASQSTMRWSKSSPPRNVSPPVASRLKTPSAISRIEMSNVPPPRS